MRFLDNPEMLACLKQKKTISVATAQRWLRKMGYQWTYDPKGQYVDGHERQDVVDYQQKVYLSAMAEFAPQMTQWNSKDGQQVDPPPGIRCVVVWYHDKSTFYAHDRRTWRWVHNKEKAKREKVILSCWQISSHRNMVGCAPMMTSKMRMFCFVQEKHMMDGLTMKVCGNK